MYIPDLKVSMIDPEINAGFICNYLSREKSENKTRPFYEKTILLYPELKDAQEILDIREKERSLKIITSSDFSFFSMPIQYRQRSF